MVVGEPQVLEFVRIDQPVQIQMHRVHRRQFVGFEQGVTRALDGPVRAERAQRPAREGRLARAELAATGSTTRHGAAGAGARA